MIHFLKKILRKLKPSERNRIVSLSPHHILLYKLILSELKKRNNFLFVDERTISYGIPRNNVLINLRHDIDSLPHTITNLTDVEEELGLRSIIYVFTDNKIYNIEKYKSIFQQLHSKKFILGLHTTAPARANPIEYFRNECITFKKCFGFSPKFFTLHGINPAPNDWEAKKRQFLVDIDEIRHEMEMEACSQVNKSLRFVEDSRCGGIFGYLREDFFKLPEVKNSKIVILTHPEHWTMAPEITATASSLDCWRNQILKELK